VTPGPAPRGGTRGQSAQDCAARDRTAQDHAGQDHAGQDQEARDRLARARVAAEAVRDPELPMLTLADLGVLCGLEAESTGAVTAWITPTYSGCPATAEMAADLAAALRAAGFEQVRVRLRLDPPWSSDRITPEGHRRLARAGISPPGPARSAGGPVPLVLSPLRRAQDFPSPACPRCGGGDTEELSRFGATPCKALWRCRACLEPFEHLKEI
jgi:ring-1,2-phenylacetyl-CoA epoxidase subunit PaaD